MKIIIAIGFLIICACDYASADCNKAYATVGAGYKFDEQKGYHDQYGNEYLFIDQSKYSARFEAGIQCEKIRFGVSHHSQWSTGAPFNETGEHYKTEFFVDFTHYWDI